MKNQVKKLIIFPIAIASVFIAVSCVDQDIQNSHDAELAEINRYIEGKGYTDIGYGIYLKFYNRDGIAILDSNVSKQDAFVINYDGTYTDGSVWETTDSSKGADLFPGRYFIYGPTQLRSGYITMFGLDTAIKYFSKGDTGSIVIPSWYAWGDYPRVFHVGMQQVIKNDTLNEQEKFTDFFFTNGFQVENELIPGVYWKHPTNPAYELSDTIMYEGQPTLEIELIGRYAETYYSSGLGRQFYPIEAAGDSTVHNRRIGDETSFPFRAVVDSALLRMQVGDELEITGGSGIGWANTGYFDPNLNIPIVPEYMPIYYRLKLISVTE